MGVDELKRAAEAAGLRYELLIYPWTGECYGSYPLLPVNHPRFEEAYALLSCKWADWITRVDCRFALLDHYLYLVFNVSMADDDLSAWITEELKIFEELFS
ncbi:hypothetical protein NUH87_31025 [Pseudomonas batumici]|uniref:hypothetical protein n=1 Tax=Pseudomonas batumici TaxID=226910 RepID=UPI0030CD6143